MSQVQAAVDQTTGITKRSVFDSNSPLESRKSVNETAYVQDQIKDGNLWNFISKNYEIESTTRKGVKRYEKWFIKNQEYLQRVFERSQLYLFHVVTELAARDMPMDLALLPIIESAYNPYAYSKAHAVGVWQFIPSTAKKFGLKQNWWVDERRNIRLATNAALNYLTVLHDEFKDWKLALAAYNCGENCVRKAIKKNIRRGRPTAYEYLRLPRETRLYIPKLQAVKNIIINHKKLNINLPTVPSEAYFEEIPLAKSIDVKKAAKYAEISVAEFLALNAEYNRPVIIAEEHRPLLIPKKHQKIFEHNLKSSEGPFVSWEIYSTERNDSLKTLSKRFRISRSRLASFNGLDKNQPLTFKTLILVPLNSTKRQSNVNDYYQHRQFISSFWGTKTRVIHRVRKGDNLSMIAKRYNVSIKSLKRWNNIRGTIVRIGQRLYIYGNPTYHRVVTGDTLSGISRRYGISIRKIKAWNGLRSNLIIKGQRLLIHKKIKSPLLKDLLT